MPPLRPLDIYLLAIGGTGMAPLACLLAADGHRVRGTDGPLYPPMSTLLETAGIRPLEGWDPAHLEPRPDLVVVGNAVRRDNPEALEAERLGLTRLSMPEALARFFLADRRPLVVAGTHGKTTTSAMAAWVWSACGRDPGYLIGGVPLDLEASFRRGGGDRFVVEGDEYNAAYFDRGAKFLHYRPETAILTSVEYDHADLYPDPASLVDAYRRLIALLPERGALVACGDTAAVREVARGARCPVVLYGEATDNDVRFAAPPEPTPTGTRFTVVEPDGAGHEVHLGLWGVHNATNALAVWAAARRDGLAPAAIAAALASFHGVRRRQEVVGEAGGVTVIDDFAHHPTAIAKTLASIAARFPGRRLVACFEPRSLTAGRAFFLDGYRTAFGDADLVLFAPIFHRDRLAPEDRLDLETLIADLARQGRAAETTASIDALLERVLSRARPGDVVVTMSSGSFAGLPRRLAEAFAERDRPAGQPSAG
ncbi:MAG: UDP-N-acetylmuramate:L-alanyl-gamma-D-glutamyl-meso-diaminopimelate ligase [Acidobacteriota bacterium]